MTARTVIHVGDAFAVLKTLPSESVQCIVTSPPYYGLRDYGESDQLGLEPTPDEYVARLVAVFREARRVLRDDGVLWLNLGDSYAGGGTIGRNDTDAASLARRAAKYGTGQAAGSLVGAHGTRPPAPGLKPKDLIGIPWRVAFALQADGWWLRSDCIWHKPNPMPESVTDRPTKAHEYVFLLSKSARYFYDADAVKEPNSETTGRYGDSNGTATAAAQAVTGGQHGSSSAFTSKLSRDEFYERYYTQGRNRRTVWTITTQPYSGAHFATMPPDLVEVCVKAGTSERGCCPECGAAWERVVERQTIPLQNVHNWVGKSEGIVPSGKRWGGDGVPSRIDTTTTGYRPTCDHDAAPVPCAVLDPFGGAGTTGLVANRLDRDAVLIELNADYAEMARQRIYGDAPMFASVEVV